MKDTNKNNNLESLQVTVQDGRIWDQPAVIMPEPILTPMTSKEASPTYTPSYNPQAGFTCTNCANRIYDPQPDYVRIQKSIIVWTDKSDHKSIALHLPSRCKRCDHEYTRFKRMQRRTEAIQNFCKSMPGSEYKMPKLITFNLDSGASNNAHPETEVKLLKKKMRQAKEILKTTAGVLGGTYVIESTSKLYGFRSGEDWVKANAFMAFSHHAHCHMVAVAPYVEDQTLVNHILNPIGLGNINYVAVKYRKELAKYISKYLTKGKTRSVTWGIMRRTKTCDSK